MTFQNGKIKVVAIDDHPLIRAGIRGQIAEDHSIHLVAEGCTGDDVLRLAEEYNPDVMLLDIEMPQSVSANGKRFKIMTVLPVLFQRHPDLAVVIISQYLSTSLFTGAFQRGVAGYLLKDDAATMVLSQAIHSVVAGRPYYSPSVTTKINYSSKKLSDRVTPRQRDVLIALVENPNQTFVEHAASLGMSVGTFKNHAHALRNQFGVETNIALVLEAIRQGMVVLPD
ncbi:MAG: response regulator transcription factor [Anaerolineae bacterium]|nr:response regulator transcription factor [Anaerolineae bacterium]